MIIFNAFQGLENLYIKFQDFPYFSRICTNPAYCTRYHQMYFSDVTFQNPTPSTTTTISYIKLRKLIELQNITLHHNAIDIRDVRHLCDRHKAYQVKNSTYKYTKTDTVQHDTCDQIIVSRAADFNYQLID